MMLTMSSKIVARGPVLSPDGARGLRIGDAVARVAKPVARVLGVPQDCEPCRRRQDQLNKLGDSLRRITARMK